MKVFKNKKQRIVAVFLSLVFAFMLVPFTDAYGANVVSTSTCSITGTYDGEEYFANYSFSSSNGSDIVVIKFINDRGDQYVCAFSLSPYTVTCTLTEGKYPNKYASNCYVTTYQGTKLYYSEHLASFCNSADSYTAYWFQEPNIASPYYVYNCGDNSTNSPSIFYSEVIQLLGGDTTGFDCSNTSSGGYSNEIGALKNVSRNTLYPDHANNVDSVFWRFRYASKTTKGYSVKTSGTKIRVYESVTYYKRSDDSVYSESPKVLVGEFDATGLQFDMDVNKAFNKTTSETDSQYIANAWTILTKQIVRNDRIYLQVVDAKGNCGDYLRIGGHADNASNATDNPQTVVDEDGNEVSEENGGYSKDDTDGDVGTSIDGDLDTADDDANSKPEEKENIGDSLDHAIATIRSLIDMIRHIPEIISILFSFLPPWCLSVVALGFVALVVLIAYKLIRG